MDKYVAVLMRCACGELHRIGTRRMIYSRLCGYAMALHDTGNITGIEYTFIIEKLHAFVSYER